MSRGWYKLYRSIDLLSEDPPLAAWRKLSLSLTFCLSLFLSRSLWCCCCCCCCCLQTVALPLSLLLSPAASLMLLTGVRLSERNRHERAHVRAPSGVEGEERRGDRGRMMCIDGRRATARMGLLRCCGYEADSEGLRHPRKGSSLRKSAKGRPGDGEGVGGNVDAMHRCSRSRWFALGPRLTFRCIRNPLTDISRAAGASVYAPRELPRRSAGCLV